MADINPNSSFNVFITGANNPIGYAVAHKLVQQGHKVTGIADGRDNAADLRSIGAMPILIDHARAGEILGMMRVAQTDVVLHLAPLTRFGVPFGNVDYHTDDLIASTVAIAQASQEHGVKFILHTSSLFIYGDVGEADETTAFIRASHPLVDALRKAENALKQAELPLTILRVGNIYSADTASLIQLIDTLRIGRPVFTGGKDAEITSWIHADDVISAILCTVETQPLGEILHIVDDTPAFPAEFVAYLTDELGLKGRNSMVPFFERPRVYKATAPLLEAGIKTSNAKARQMLAWSPKYPNYKTGIDQILLTLRSQLPVKR